MYRSMFFGFLAVYPSRGSVFRDPLSAGLTGLPSHKQLHAPLLALTLNNLNGSSQAPSSIKPVAIVSKLYAALPCTGWKVGASNLWRKSVDETLEFTRGAALP